MRKAALLFLLFVTQPVFALLSPLNQSIVELEQILSSQELQQKLPTSEAIHSIVAVQNGYLLSTDHYQMLIEVQYQPQEMPGPAKFQLMFHEPRT